MDYDHKTDAIFFGLFYKVFLETKINFFKNENVFF